MFVSSGSLVSAPAAAKVASKIGGIDWRSKALWVEAALSIAGFALSFFFHSILGMIAFAFNASSIYLHLTSDTNRQIAFMTDQLNQAEKELREGQKKIADLTNQLSITAKQLEQTRIEWQHEVEGLAQVNTNLESTNRNLTTTTKQYALENQRLAAAKNGLEANLTALKASYESIQKQVATFASANLQMGSQIGQLERNSGSLSSTQRGFQEAVRSYERAFEQDVQALRNETQQWKKAGETLTTQNKDLANRTRALDTQLQTANQLAAKMGQKNQELTEAITKMDLEIQRLRTIEKEWQETENKLASERSALQAAGDKISNERKQIETDIARQTKLKQEVADTMHTARISMEALNKELLHKKAELESLTKEVEEKKKLLAQ